jgi:hypothetical protein
VLLAGLSLTGCAQPDPTHSVPAACGSAAPNAVPVDAALRNGRADPEPHRVEIPVNSPVLLGVTSDVAAEVHVHGYDLVYPVRPGSPACVLFVAGRTGVFDVEAHPEILLLQLEVR